MASSIAITPCCSSAVAHDNGMIPSKSLESKLAPYTASSNLTTFVNPLPAVSDNGGRPSSSLDSGSDPFMSSSLTTASSPLPAAQHSEVSPHEFLMSGSILSCSSSKPSPRRADDEESSRSVFQCVWIQKRLQFRSKTLASASVIYSLASSNHISASSFCNSRSCEFFPE